MSIILNTEIENDSLRAITFFSEQVNNLCFSVESIEDLSKLPDNALVQGMHVYVGSLQKMYMYNDGEWVSCDTDFEAGSGILIKEDSEGRFVISRYSPSELYLDFPYDFKYDFTYIMELNDGTYN